MDKLERFIAARLEEGRMPGLSCAAVVGERVAWSAGFGWADVENAIPMTADTIMNVASICKPVTATAVLLLWQAVGFDLDADIGGFLGFRVRNPRHPEIPITVRQLLTHRSSIMDGPAYPDSYVAGTPAMSAAEWLRAYLIPGGTLYDAEKNFHVWAPGTVTPPDEPRPYSNVGYGLLSLVVEGIAGEPFESYCRRALFEPLGMSDCTWSLDEVPAGRHTALYTLIPESRAELERLEFFVAGEREAAEHAKPDSLFRHALYSEPFPSAGGLRASAREMGTFLALYTGGGGIRGKALLRHDTMRRMFSDESFGRALCWQRAGGASGRVMWFHGGSDPGVGTLMTFDPERAVGVVFLCNYQGPAPCLQDIHRAIMQEFADI